MSATDYLPRSDADLLAWVNHLSSMITAAPTTYGLTAPIAVALAAQVTAFSTAYAAAIGANTRGPSTVFAKAQARTSLVNFVRTVVRQVQGTMTVTNQQRMDLGITVHSQPTPIPAPGSAPAFEIGVVNGYIVNAKLHDSTSGSKLGRPAGVSGASIFSFTGATPPGDISAWKFEGNTSRTKVQVAFDSSLAPGTKVWLTAFWFNPRKQSGPACTPVSTNLQGGSVSMAA